MGIAEMIRPLVVNAIKELYSVDLKEADLTINQTKPEFEGDYTVVLYSFFKQLKIFQEQLGKELGEHLLLRNPQLLLSYNVIKGFLNLVVLDSYWVNFLSTSYSNRQIGHQKPNEHRVIVEYSSPNTNK